MMVDTLTEIDDKYNQRYIRLRNKQIDRYKC